MVITSAQTYALRKHTDQFSGKYIKTGTTHFLADGCQSMKDLNIFDVF